MEFLMIYLAIGICVAVYDFIHSREELAGEPHGIVFFALFILVFVWPYYVWRI